MTTVPASKTVELKDSELIDSLRRFPQGVLPIAVLSELTSRGAAIQPELLRRLESAMDDVEAGIGAVPGECFFCSGLLLAHPCSQQLATLERIVRLDREVRDHIAGELVYETFPDILRGVAKSDGPSIVLSWLEPLIRDAEIAEFVRASLLSVVPFLVADEAIPREQAVDWIVDLLREREKCKYDALSAFAITELSHLGAVELDEFIKECFRQNQIDDSVYCLDDWHRERQAIIAGKPPFQVLREISDPSILDIVDHLKYWHGFSEISVSLHPSEAIFETNPGVSEGFPRRHLRTAEIDEHIQSFRESHFDYFPGEAFKDLGRDVEPILDRLVEEIRVGLRKVGGPDVRDNNAPFLALVLLISRRARIPGDLLLEIIDLPVNQFEDLFGDSLDQALVAALSLSIVADTSRIEERLTDLERSEFSRSALSEFFLHSAFHGHLTREESVEALHRAWRSTLDAEEGHYSWASRSLLESLCLMCPKQHKEELLKEIEGGTCGPQFTTAQLAKMLEDPSRGVEHVHAIWNRISSPMELVSNAVMFSDNVLRPETEGRYEDCKLGDVQPSPALPSGEMTSVTVRNTVPSVGRNDACPCGSGRKYKKCCLRNK